MREEDSPFLVISLKLLSMKTDSMKFSNISFQYSEKQHGCINCHFFKKVIYSQNSDLEGIGMETVRRDMGRVFGCVGLVTC